MLSGKPIGIGESMLTFVHWHHVRSAMTIIQTGRAIRSMCRRSPADRIHRRSDEKTWESATRPAAAKGRIFVSFRTKSRKYFPDTTGNRFTTDVNAKSGKGRPQKGHTRIPGPRDNVSAIRTVCTRVPADKRNGRL